MTNAVAIISGTFYLLNKTADRIERRKHVAKRQKTDLPLGDGNAKVGQTRGFSHWYSTRDAGMTVKAESHVTITCGQSEEEIRAAMEEAARIAESVAVQGAEEMDLHLDSFAKDVHR
jgi:hypothetical protein